MAAKTANPTMIVTEFRPAEIRVRWPPSTVRVRPVANSRNVSGGCPVMASMSRYQAGTNATSSSQARRLRLWLRSANRHATGNCRNAGGAAGDAAGPAAAGARSAAGMIILPGTLAGGQAAVRQVGEQVEPVLLEDQVGDDHDGLAAGTQVGDEVPEPQVGFPVEALVRLVEQQHA